MDATPDAGAPDAAPDAETATPAAGLGERGTELARGASLRVHAMLGASGDAVVGFWDANSARVRFQTWNGSAWIPLEKDVDAPSLAGGPVLGQVEKGPLRVAWIERQGARPRERFFLRVRTKEADGSFRDVSPAGDVGCNVFDMPGSSDALGNIVVRRERARGAPGIDYAGGRFWIACADATTSDRGAVNVRGWDGARWTNIPSLDLPLSVGYGYSVRLRAMETGDFIALVGDRGHAFRRKARQWDDVSLDSGVLYWSMLVTGSGAVGLPALSPPSKLVLDTEARKPILDTPFLDSSIQSGREGALKQVCVGSRDRTVVIAWTVESHEADGGQGQVLRAVVVPQEASR